MKSMEEMMKAAQEAAQNVQVQMEEAQKKLDTLEVEGKSGGGLVSVKPPFFELLLSKSEKLSPEKRGHVGGGGGKHDT